MQGRNLRRSKTPLEGDTLMIVVKSPCSELCNQPELNFLLELRQIPPLWEEQPLCY